LLAYTRQPRPSTSTSFLPLLRPPPTSTLFPYTTLFRSLPLSRCLFFDSPLFLGVVLEDGSPISSQPFSLGQSLVSLSPESLNARSEEHTSELQSRENLVCRLLLEKKNTRAQTRTHGGR